MGPLVIESFGTLLPQYIVHPTCLDPENRLQITTPKQVPVSQSVMYPTGVPGVEAALFVRAYTLTPDGNLIIELLLTCYEEDALVFSAEMRLVVAGGSYRYTYIDESAPRLNSKLSYTERYGRVVDALNELCCQGEAKKAVPLQIFGDFAWDL